MWFREGGYRKNSRSSGHQLRSVKRRQKGHPESVAAYPSRVTKGVPGKARSKSDETGTRVPECEVGRERSKGGFIANEGAREKKVNLGLGHPKGKACNLNGTGPVFFWTGKQMGGTKSRETR